MIWVLLKRLLFALAKCLIPPSPGYRSKIDPADPCPACGHIGGKLHFERVAVREGLVLKCRECESTAIVRIGKDQFKCNQCSNVMAAADTQSIAVLRKSCNGCGFAYFEEPISAPRWPAV